MEKDVIAVFRNATLLRHHELRVEDLWVRNGVVINPEPLFFDEHRSWDVQIDCGGALLAPGLIDLQINGAFGVDFTADIKCADTAKTALDVVSKGLLSHGVTSYCPTVVTSTPDVYRNILPHLGPRRGGLDGAEVLGVHVEGPFISKDKKGAHNPDSILSLDNGFESVISTYGSLDHVRIVTLAPELDPECDVVRQLVGSGVRVSLGHSTATLSQAEAAVRSGANMVTHLFNAMAAFHHRADPGLLGLPTSSKLDGNEIYCGLIADGIHTHPAALRIAYRTHFSGLCLVTDAICAMGLDDGIYHLGDQMIEVSGERAVIAGTDTLCGAIASLFKAMKKFMKGSMCSLVEALETVTLHPAQALGIEKKKGTLDFGSDADFIMIDTKNELELISTWIGGECVYKNSST